MNKFLGWLILLTSAGAYAKVLGLLSEQSWWVVLSPVAFGAALFAVLAILHYILMGVSKTYRMGIQKKKKGEEVAKLARLLDR